MPSGMIGGQASCQARKDLIGLHGVNKMTKHKSNRATFLVSDYLRIVPGDDTDLACSNTFSY